MPFKKGDKNINRKGRKAKYEELGLPAKLDEIMPISKVLKVLEFNITSNKSLKAVELWMNYYYGKPKETMKLDGDLTIDSIKIVRASNKGDTDK